jgi:hypothetical protein
MTTLTAAQAAPATRDRLRGGELAAESAWRPLYRIGGAAAFAVLALVPIQLVVFVVWPLPTTVTGWFALFQSNALVGLLSLDLLLVVDWVLLGVVLLALSVALRRVHPSFVAIAVTAEVVAVATYFASTVAFEMLTLSGRHAAATTDAERSLFLAAGQVMVATWQGTAFNVSYVLAAIAALLVSAVMLRGGPFGKATAYSGILYGIFGLVPPTAGSVGFALSLLSLLPMWTWLFLLGRRLLQLSGEGPASAS